MSKSVLVRDRATFNTDITAPIGVSDPAAGAFITLNASGMVQGTVSNNLRAQELGRKIRAICSDLRFLNVMCNEPASDMVTNGDFATDTDWGKGTGWSIAGGVASCDGSQTGNTNLLQTIGVIDGIKYRITFTISNYVAGLVTLNSGGYSAGTPRSANGTFTETIETILSNGKIYLIGDINFQGDIDNVSVTPAYLDISGNNLDGQFMGSGWTPSVREMQGRGWMYDMDGTTQYIDLGDSDLLSFGDGSNDEAVSWFGMIEVVDTANNQYVICKRDSSIAREWNVTILTNETFAFSIWDDSVTNVFSGVVTNAALSTGLHSFVATYTGVGGATAGNGMKIFIDGLEVACTVTNDASYVAMENTSVHVFVGARTNATPLPADFMQGKQGNIGITGGVLSPADAYMLHQLNLCYYSENGVSLN